MGRIHRYKQKHDPVVILNLVAGQTREGRVLKTLLEKLERMRKELNSDKVFDVIGRLFEGKSLKSYLEEAVTETGAEQACQSIDGLLTPEQVRAKLVRERHLYGEGGDVRRELPRLREQEDQEIYRRLLPGYVRQYIEKAAPLVGIDIEGNLDQYFSFVPRQPGVLDALLPVLESHSPEERQKLTVNRPAEDEPAIWLHPGEPVFDRLRSLVSIRVESAARRGATFLDPATDRPYFFQLGRVIVVRQADSALPGLRRPKPLEVRLVGIKQYPDGEITECSPEHLLLLRGHQQAAPRFAPLVAAASQKRQAAKAWLRGNVAAARAGALAGALRETLPAQTEFLSKGFDYQEAELAAQRVRLSEKVRAGDARAQAELTRIRERQRALAFRKDVAIRERQREPELIAVGEIEILAQALVVPSADPEDRRRQDALIERVAMEIARAYEDSHGAVVYDVHTPELASAAGLQDYPGFDLLSKRPDGAERSIEVKGRAGVGDIEVSDNEWAKACNLRHRYWLYVVYGCGEGPRACSASRIPSASSWRATAAGC